MVHFERMTGSPEWFREMLQLSLSWREFERKPFYMLSDDSRNILSKTEPLVVRSAHIVSDWQSIAWSGYHSTICASYSCSVSLCKMLSIPWDSVSVFAPDTMWKLNCANDPVFNDGLFHEKLSQNPYFVNFIMGCVFCSFFMVGVFRIILIWNLHWAWDICDSQCRHSSGKRGWTMLSSK